MVCFDQLMNACVIQLIVYASRIPPRPIGGLEAWKPGGLERLRLVGRMVGWLVWLVGWLVGWFERLDNQIS